MRVNIWVSPRKVKALDNLVEKVEAEPLPKLRALSVTNQVFNGAPFP